MSLWTDQLREIVERTRAEIAAERKSQPKSTEGPVAWDIPQSIREALWEDMDSGEYERRARELTADDPNMQQL